MKRYLPFIIIVVVALLTAGAGTLLYRAKMSAAPATATTSSNSVEEEDSGSLYAQGPADAPAKLEIYGDFQCPACATASAAISKLQPEYGPRLRVIFHEFPLEMHAHALEAAMAAEAAGLQGHFWEMHDLLYRYQEIWSRISNPQRFFAAYAKSLGLDVPRFEADSKSPDLKGRIMTEGDAGVARGVKNTPTIFINGTEMRGVFNEAGLRSAIDSALAAQKKS